LNWCHSDDKGVFENDPLLIKSNCFPRRKDVRQKDINLWLDQLVKARFLVPLKFANKSYFINRTFGTHQRIDKPQPSKIPDEVIKDTLDRFYSENVPGTVLAVLESMVKESNGVGAGPPANFKKNNREEKKQDAPAPPVYADVLEFFKRSMKGKFAEQKIINEAGKFFNHYEAMGWKIGGQPIMKWDSKALEWMIRDAQGVRV
jgi:hypothetical protein